MKKILSVFTVILCLAASCQKYDDTQIKKDISDLQEQVASLRAWCESSQAAIDAVESLKKAVENFNGISYIEYFSGDQGNGYYIGLDDGQEITIYNVKQEGRNAYLGNVIINQSSVVFTLSDGTSFTLPRKDGQIHFASYDAVTVNLIDTMEVLLPKGFKKSDFAAFTAKVESGDGVATKAGYSGSWNVAAIAPKFDEQGVLVDNPAVVFSEIPFEKTTAVLTVSIIDNNGNKTSASRVIYSGNEDKLGKIYKEWEDVFKSEIQEWSTEHCLEFLTWYMMSLVEEQTEEGYSDFLNKFVANHRTLLEIFLLLDRNDDATKNIKRMWEEAKYDAKELEEGDTEEEEGPSSNGVSYNTLARFWDWMGAGHSRWGLSALPDSRKVCHVTLPAAYQALSFEPILPNSLSFKANLFLSRLLRFQHTDLNTMFDRGVRVFDFQVGMHEGALHGYSNVDPIPLAVPCKAKVETELNVLVNNLKNYPKEFVVLVVREANEEDLGACRRFFYQYSQSHNNLFIPFRKDLTVGEARGHIILLWTDEDWPDESIPRFGAVISEDDTDRGIKVWNGGSKEWETAAPLWIQDIDLGEVANNDVAWNKAREHTNQFLKYVDDFKAQACKQGDCTWSVNYFDKMMWWPLPDKVKRMINQMIKKKLPELPVEITHYPDASWSARYLHNHLIDNLHVKFYSQRYNAPGGIVYLNYAAVRNTYGPFRFPFPLDVYGRSAVAYTLSMNGPCKMPYER